MKPSLKRSPKADLELEYLKEIRAELRHGLTMKGALVSFALLHGEKNIENRTKRIKTGWVAVHTGAGKIDPRIKDYVLKNLVEKNITTPKEEELPHSAIVGAIHIKESYDYKPDDTNPWALGPVCNVVDKAVAFDEIIPCKGAITLKWPFEIVDKKENKSGKFDGVPLLERVRLVIEKQIKRKTQALQPGEQKPE